jgi:hypothetical protein
MTLYKMENNLTCFKYNPSDKMEERLISIETGIIVTLIEENIENKSCLPPSYRVGPSGEIEIESVDLFLVNNTLFVLYSEFRFLAHIMTPIDTTD